MDRIKTIAIIGKGNVGTFLHDVFVRGDFGVTLVDSRTMDNLDPNVDLIVISVSDSAIKEVADNILSILPNFGGIAVHTAGSVGMDVLKNFKKHGVFYPLQSLSKNIKPESIEDIPIFIEGNTQKVEKALESVACNFFEKVYLLNAERRKKLHLASVIANNFTNAMYAMANDIMQAEGLPFELLIPLIRRTAEKVEITSPIEAQTGPASRGDFNVIEEHIGMLKKQNPELERIYRDISQYIYLKRENEQN